MVPGESSLVFHPSIGRVPRRALREFLEELSSRVAKGRAVGCLIARDQDLRALNRRFRGKNSATDVLSFPASADGFLGDIAISFERAQAQARELSHPVEDELRILMLHGVLHLAGYDHESDRGEMARAERRWRRKLGLPLALIERAGGNA